MNNKRRIQTCECGSQFITSEEFGNETKCDACYERHSEEFLDWVEQLPRDEFDKLWQEMREYTASLGIRIDVTKEERAETRHVLVERRAQRRVDLAAAALLEDIDF
jgi:hypothetical protein